MRYVNHRNHKEHNCFCEQWYGLCRDLSSDRRWRIGSRKIARQLDDARVGGIVTLSGKLIEVTGKEGWQWRSSLTRDDTGNGACELIWVESVSFAEKVGV